MGEIHGPRFPHPNPSALGLGLGPMSVSPSSHTPIPSRWDWDWDPRASNRPGTVPRSNVCPNPWCNTFPHSDPIPLRVRVATCRFSRFGAFEPESTCRAGPSPFFSCHSQLRATGFTATNPATNCQRLRPETVQPCPCFSFINATTSLVAYAVKLTRPLVLANQSPS